MTVAMPDGCFEIGDEYLALYLIGALNTQTLTERIGALVAHVSDIARPATGGAKVLVVISQFAARIADPVEVRLYDEGDETVLDTLVVREGDWARPWEATRLAVPFREFEHGVNLHPELIAPLLVVGGSSGFVLILRSPDNREVFTKSTKQMPALSIPPGARTRR